MQLNECHIENSLSGKRYIGQEGYRFDQIYSRRRCKTKRFDSPSQLNRSTMDTRQQQHHHHYQRPLSVHTSNAFKTVILFFIILLSNGQITSVLGTHSRDSPNSIYRNNHNVNNVNNIESYAVTAIENVTDTEFGLSIVDIDDTFSGNNTDGIHNESERRSRRSPVYHNEFAVYVPNGAAIADSVADKHGFTNMGQVSVFVNFSIFFGSQKFSIISWSFNQKYN